MSESAKKYDLKNFRDFVKDTTGIEVTDETIMQSIFMHELTRVPGKKEASDHWAIKNPGAADQFRCEAKAARSALGFGEDDPNVSPRDLRLAVDGLKANR